MIPSILDHQLRRGVADFIRTTFSITTPSMSKMVDDLCDEPGRMFKGPYISLGLNFENGEHPAEYHFPELSIPYPPFKHQELAWERIKNFQSTLVATGTGSGKTESFLYPILDHVRLQKERGWTGIKAILLYPMNALATDQAERIAKAIFSTPSLRGKITAGLYIGGEQKDAPKVMGEKTVISDRKTLRLSPPDILLTNYKMLDYLFIRPSDKPLWDANRSGNGSAPSTLRYLVVDELHTFDGAQGSDLAMLIRRLKHRLGCLPGNLCCIGTSATLGGPGSSQQMLNYAEKIFGESFLADSLITEHRQSSVVFLSGTYMDLKGSGFPVWEQREQLLPVNFTTPQEYLSAQAAIWFPQANPEVRADPVYLGKLLKGHVAFRTLIDIVSNVPRTEKEILSDLSRYFEALDPKFIARIAGGVDIAEIDEFLSGSLMSILALVAHARSGHPFREKDTVPFIQQVRVQSWIREMRRMVATVEQTPRLDFADDISKGETNFLPLVYCRECGNAGWVGLLPNQNSDQLRNDDKALRDFYKTFFQRQPSQHIRFLFPDLKGRAVLKPGRTATNLKVCIHCLKLQSTTNKVCSSCSNDRFIEVLVPDSRYQNTKGHWFTRKHCPGCGTRESLVVLGAQSATLSSALINQLFASPYNNDKKLIAFSDNVQDAAHRASFFGARTWKFNFRAAVQQYLKSAECDRSLIGLGERVLEYWKTRFNDEVATVAMFLPSDLEYINEVRASRSGTSNDFSPWFWSALSKRLDWEVFTEFSLDCRRGRTLEKSGCSVAFVSYEDVPAAWEELSVRLQNLDPILKGKISTPLLKQCIHGILRRWFHNGAAEHPALDSYIASLGNPFLLSRNNFWMKRFGEHSRMPAFPWRQISGRDNQERLEPIQSRVDRPTSWYAHWILKYWGEECPTILAYYEEIITLLFGFMEQMELIIRREIDKTPLWMLNTQKIKISSSVCHFRCHECGHQISVPSEEKTIFTGLHCLKAPCLGTYVDYNLAGRYYGELYDRGNLVRLLPSEHTALLEREEREDIENQFKAKPEVRTPWSPNLLSCTPTLELGIDIGDLSSVLLCSVPPEQASFMQRIGRAGRTDGNAFIATVAEGQPHDLYFWSDPLEMLHGNIEPPGVFLDATAVLERQLVAFCLDRWVFEDSAAAIPKQVSSMISNWKNKKDGVFPWSFIHYVRRNTSGIIADFLALLGDTTSENTRRYLSGFLDNSGNSGTFEFKINECLQLSERMRSSLVSRRRQLDSDIAKKSADPASNLELMEELQMERGALARLITKIDGKKCYELFTDDGLIPNYAFPEAGVQLKSIVYKRNQTASGSGSKSLKEVYEYERAAATAISDFAPGNYFYAHKRRVRIDQVDHTVSPPERFRLCPECGYMELEIKGATPAQCPQCGCLQFGAHQQVQQLLRIRQVYATSGDRGSLVGDDSDNREVRFYERAMLVGLRDSELLGAWQLEDPMFPFGFEVRRKVLLRELNFGPFSLQNIAIRIAGEDVAAEGFEICKSCGRVSIDGKPIEHTFHCNLLHPGNNQQSLTATFLYRDFEGEALRIFLPTLSQGADKDIKSFLAAFHLGLRLHYQGDVSHLQATLQTEPIPGNASLKKQFIVIYDRIPGGTGYLKQFMQEPGLLRSILKRSLERLSSCSCQYINGRDGCYRCLLAHRNSREMDLISRKTAMELLRKIIDTKVDFTELRTGVSKIDLVQVLESELEKKFISVLKEYSELSGTEHKIKIEPKVLAGGNGYHLTVDGQGWVIEPQVVLDNDKGTVVPTRVDFLISHKERSDLRPIALSLDGWEYHHARMETDTRQRLALHRSGKFRIWTLTWDDLDDLLKPAQNAAGLLGMSNSDGYYSFLARRSLQAWQNIATIGSLRLLLKFLSDPSEECWRYICHGIVLSNLIPEDSDGTTWAGSISKWLPASHPGWNPLWQGFGCKREESIGKWTGWIGKELSQNAVILIVNESLLTRGEEKASWQDFWRTVNVFQFITDFIFITEQASVENRYNDIPMTPNVAPDTEIGETWQHVMEFCSDERIIELLRYVYKAGIDSPVPLHEIIEDDMIVAQTEIAWPDNKIAIVSSTEDQKVLTSMGWQVFMTVNIEIERILNLLRRS